MQALIYSYVTDRECIQNVLLGFTDRVIVEFKKSQFPNEFTYLTFSKLDGKCMNKRFEKIVKLISIKE